MDHADGKFVGCANGGRDPPTLIVLHDPSAFSAFVCGQFLLPAKRDARSPARPRARTPFPNPFQRLSFRPAKGSGRARGPRRRSNTDVKLLGAVEKPFYRAVNPLVEWLIRAGVRPNTITTIGTGLVLISAMAYGMGHIRIGGALL